MSPQKWIRETNAIGIISKSGRYGGGTFADPDIAFEFASWLSPEFKLYVIQEFQKFIVHSSSFLFVVIAFPKEFFNMHIAKK